ncbi:MAG: hypothetical protein IJS32_08630, partial [Kiritimatiellae bacterium]|nr:hypothetical protein [Kiritimatiellia bacterium]
TALQCEKGPPLSIEDAARGTNPRFSEGGDYRVNCQRCVAAYELRRRGYAVEAKAKPRGRAGNLVVWGDEMFRDLNRMGERMMQFDMPEAAVRSAIASAPDGARFIVYVTWKRRDTHVFIAEKTPGGTVRFIDPQTNNPDASGYFAQGRRGRFGLLRVDNLPINGDAGILQNAFTPSTQKQRTMTWTARKP